MKNIDNFEKDEIIEIDNRASSIVSLITGFLSLIFVFLNIPIAIICAVSSIILSIRGFKSFGICKRRSILAFLVSFVAVLGSGVSVYNYFIENGETGNAITVDEAEIEIKKLLYSSWQEQNKYGNSVLVLNDDGTYYWYMNSNDLDDNYIKGVYTLNYGIEEDINSQKLYQDDAFYYYQLFLTKIKVVSKTDEIYNDINKRQESYTVGLDINSNTISCLEDTASGNTKCFTKIDALKEV